MTASKLQPLSAQSNSDDELWARLASNTPRPPIGKHVLIVGVFGPNNQLFKQLVELQGSTTVLSSVGEQALQAAIKDHPDLIIVDVMGSQEFEFGKILKGDVRTREIPLIGVSAHDEHLVVAAGYDEFVAKPIGSPELPQVAGSAGRPPGRYGRRPSECPTGACHRLPSEYRPAAPAEESSSPTTADSSIRAPKIFASYSRR